MNKYKLTYEWTEPSCDCPFIPYINSLIVEGESISEVEKEYDASFLSMGRDNFKISDIALVEKDIHLLSRGLSNNVQLSKSISGTAASFLLSGIGEVIIITKGAEELRGFCARYRLNTGIDESKTRDVVIYNKG